MAVNRRLQIVLGEEERDQRALTTHIVVERRGAREDADLELAFRRIRDGANEAKKTFGFEIVFANKKTNSAGLRLADLTARPIGRHVLGSTQPNRSWTIIEPKIHRNPNGDIKGWELKSFPKKAKGFGTSRSQTPTGNSPQSDNVGSHVRHAESRIFAGFPGQSHLHIFLAVGRMQSLFSLDRITLPTIMRQEHEHHRNALEVRG